MHSKSVNEPFTSEKQDPLDAQCYAQRIDWLTMLLSCYCHAATSAAWLGCGHDIKRIQYSPVGISNVWLRLQKLLYFYSELFKHAFQYGNLCKCSFVTLHNQRFHLFRCHIPPPLLHERQYPMMFQTQVDVFRQLRSRLQAADRDLCFLAVYIMPDLQV